MMNKRVCILLILVSGVGLHAQRSVEGNILRRADLTRNPFLGTDIELNLEVASKQSGKLLRQARFSMVTHRGDRTLMLMHQQDATTPGALLIADDTYYLLLPKAEKPVALPLSDVISGDMSHAGFLRVNLRVRYQPRIEGAEERNGQACWLLHLEPKSHEEPFGCIRYWVAKENYHPQRLEFYSDKDELLKAVDFTQYQKTGMGWRPKEMQIHDPRRPDERITLTLGKPASIGTDMLAFDLADLIKFRQTARTLAMGQDTPVSGKQIIRVMRQK